MARSHGKVYDLFNNVELNILDVEGQVPEFPTILPYENYPHNVIVYKSVLDHYELVGRLQELTTRVARQERKEIWSWVLQLLSSDTAVNTNRHGQIHSIQQRRVGNPPQSRSLRASPRGSRNEGDRFLSVPQRSSHATLSPQPQVSQDTLRSPFLSSFRTNTRPQRRQAPQFYTAPSMPYPQNLPRRFDPELLEHEEILRMFILVVQCPDHLLPNFIEALYRLIDYYEGNGHSLQCAITDEIPNLWDFEYHPKMLAMREELRIEAESDPGQIELLKEWASSERMAYTEKKFGIALPGGVQEEKFPLNHPKINLPTKREKYGEYFGACFKSRQKAMSLLLSAGMTIRQIGNFDKNQKEHPLKTRDGHPFKKLEYYERNLLWADRDFDRKEDKEMKRRRWVEAVINTRMEGGNFRTRRRPAPNGTIVPAILIPKAQDEVIMGQPKQARAREETLNAAFGPPMASLSDFLAPPPAHAARITNPNVNLTTLRGLNSPAFVAPDFTNQLELRIPVLIFFPNAVLPNRTDALLLGHITETGAISISRAIFLPTSLYHLFVGQIRHETFSVVELYARNIQLHGRPNSHKIAYKKLQTLWTLMTSTSSREIELTKRWMVGPADEWGRGAVWEGWGLEINSTIEISARERGGTALRNRIEGDPMTNWENNAGAIRIAETDMLLGDEDEGSEEGPESGQDEDTSDSDDSDMSMVDAYIPQFDGPKDYPSQRPPQNQTTGTGKGKMAAGEGQQQRPRTPPPPVNTPFDSPQKSQAMRRGSINGGNIGGVNSKLADWAKKQGGLK